MMVEQFLPDLITLWRLFVTFPRLHNYFSSFAGRERLPLK